jgi:simple sugar transport system substrate-binding protein
MQLFLFNISGGLMKPTDTDTGTAIVVKATVAPYLGLTRWEGTASKEAVATPPKPIPY